MLFDLLQIIESTGFANFKNVKKRFLNLCVRLSWFSASFRMQVKSVHISSYIPRACCFLENNHL